MDGYHYYRRELDAMEDPAAAHRRLAALCLLALYCACVVRCIS
jgi:hypothetical protein